MTLAGFVRDGGYNVYTGARARRAPTRAPTADRDPERPRRRPARFIPRAVRDALDEVARKISLADWRALTRPERTRLDHARPSTRAATTSPPISSTASRARTGPAAARARRRRTAPRERCPFGLNVAKPRHFRDMVRIAWRNRDQLPYAWRILRDGVCDGCALGPRGLRDDVIDGVHLCMTRLELLRLNTMPALDPARARTTSPRSARMTSAELRALGRLPFPDAARARRDGVPPPHLGRGRDARRRRACARRRPSAWPSSRPRAASPTRSTTSRRRWRARSAPTTSTTTPASATPPARPR